MISLTICLKPICTVCAPAANAQPNSHGHHMVSTAVLSLAGAMAHAGAFVLAYSVTIIAMLGSALYLPLCPKRSVYVVYSLSICTAVYVACKVSHCSVDIERRWWNQPCTWPMPHLSCSFVPSRGLLADAWLGRLQVISAKNHRQRWLVTT